MEDLRGLNLCGHMLIFSTGNATYDDSSVDVIGFSKFSGGLWLELSADTNKDYNSLGASTVVDDVFNLTPFGQVQLASNL